MIPGAANLKSSICSDLFWKITALMELKSFSRLQPRQSPFFCKIASYRSVFYKKGRMVLSWEFFSEKLFGETPVNKCYGFVKSKAPRLLMKFRTVILLGALACILLYAFLTVAVLVHIFKIKCYSIALILWQKLEICDKDLWIW